MSRLYNLGSILLAAALLIGCGPKETPKPATGPTAAAPTSTSTTIPMRDRLAKMVQMVNIQKNSYLSHQRARYWKNWLAANPSPEAKGRMAMAIIKDFIRANENQAALDLLETMNTDLFTNPVTKRRADIQLRMQKALAWLRLGERQNCIAHHTSDSCIFPIQSGGVHTKKEGARRAHKLYREVLAIDPDNLDARWLVNLTAMLFGEFPDAVPTEFQLPAESFRSDIEFPHFPDIAHELGVDVMALAGGGAVADFNNDHLLDIVVSSMGLADQLQITFNRGQGKFENRTYHADIEGIIGGLNLNVADYDNDGWLDIFVMRGAWMQSEGKQPNSLLHNDGDGTFSDVTEEAGLLSFFPTQTAVWFDANNDGWIDLFIGNEVDERTRLPSEFYLNNRDGTFSEKSIEFGLRIKKYVKGVTSADYNNDGRSDLFVSVYDEANLLFRNDGPDENGQWRFTEVAKEAGVTEPEFSFPCWFWDYDNDGWEDLFVAGYEMPRIGIMAAAYLGQTNTAVGPKIYRNNRQGGFDDLTKESKLEKCWLAMGVNFGDLDNDGHLDFYIGTGNPEMQFVMPNRMYRNAGDRSFQDVTTAGGFGHLQKGHAISFADFDNDGDQDVHAVMGGAYGGDGYMNALFQNPLNTNAWVKLKLVGKTSNRSAIGARIHVTVETKNGERHLHRTVSTGGSFGCNPLRQEIGLGHATSIKSVNVYWPVSETRQEFKDLEIRKLYRITEGSETAEPIPLP
ncbi:MAG: FG-GAP-like repeat-containing protein [Limisphaerales bacterium]